MLNEKQTELFKRLHEALNNNIPLRKLEYSHEEVRELASYGLLTRKPVLAVFNLSEGQSAAQADLGVSSVALQGKLEMEIAQLSPEDAAMFMEEYGIKELSLTSAEMAAASICQCCITACCITVSPRRVTGKTAATTKVSAGTTISVVTTSATPT